MENLSIRQATINDLATLRNMEQGLIKAERPFDVTIREDPVVYYDLESMLTDPDVRVVVAEADGQIVSCGYARVEDARTYLDHKKHAWMGFMFTLDEYRGKGINGQIVEVLSAWADTKGLKEIRLTVYEENTPAIRAYEKVGFKKHIVEMRMRIP